jgi:hypothetical protein
LVSIRHARGDLAQKFAEQNTHIGQHHATARQRLGTSVEVEHLYGTTLLPT